MKKFRFRLQPLLKVKRHKERQRQKELAAVLQKIQCRQSSLKDIARAKTETLDSQRVHSVGQLSVDSLLLHSRYLLRLKGRELTDNEILRELSNKADESRNRLAQASKEKKIYETLKENQLDAYVKESERIENAELDEIAIMAYSRK